MRAKRALLSLALVLVPAIAVAQFIAPVIQPTRDLRVEEMRFNLDAFRDNQAPVELRWKTAVSQLRSWEYELTYDIGANTSSPTPTLVPVADDASDRNTGGARNDIEYNIRVFQSDIVRAAERPENGGVDDARRTLVLRVFEAGDRLGENLNSSSSQTWTFEYDTKPPPAPTPTGASPGDRRLLVQWTPPDTTTDVDVYEILYVPVVTSTDGFVITEDTPGVITQRSGRTTTQASISDGLVNGVPAAFAIRSIDEYDNEGPLSVTMYESPVQVSDYWQIYKDAGGNDQGGFCFIATAAYGSYAHPAVQVLRAFRDHVLLETLPGVVLVEAYYAVSPPLADVIRAHDGLAAFVRLLLWPIAIGCLFVMFVPIAGLLVFLTLLLARVRRRSLARAATIGLLVLGAVAFSSPASADLGMRPGAEDALGLGFYFKGGPYMPAMGNEDNNAQPGFDEFRLVYGTHERPLFSLGVEYALYNDFGAAGVGGSFGFMQFVGKGRFASGENAGEISTDTTVFNLIPTTFTLFYRFTPLADNHNIPIVPYVNGGLAYHIFWITNGRGNVSLYEPADGSEALPGRGGKLGFTGTVGVALLLNWIDKGSSLRLYQSSSIRATYLFFELQAQQVDGFGADGFDLSDINWNLGVYLEL